MKTKKLLSILLTLAMLATLLVVVPVATTSAASANDAGATLIYEKDSSLPLTHNWFVAVNSNPSNSWYFGNMGMTIGKKYMIEFSVQSPSYSTSERTHFYFDWCNNSANSKSNCSSWEKRKALAGIYDDGSNDCVAMPSPPWDTFSRGSGANTYNYSLFWDTATNKFIVYLNYIKASDGSRGYYSHTYQASGTVVNSDILAFKVENSGSTTATLDNFKVYEVNADYYLEQSVSATRTNRTSTTVNLDSVMTTGNKYDISWNMTPSSVSGWPLQVALNNSNAASAGQFGLFLMYDDATNAMFISDYNYLRGMSDNLADITTRGVDFHIIWDTVTGRVDLIAIFPNGKTYSCDYSAGVIASGSRYGDLVINGANTVTVNHFAIKQYTSLNSVYTSSSGWNLSGTSAIETSGGSLLVPKGLSHAASFTPSLEQGKIYEITYDVSGLGSIPADGQWNKTFAVALSAGGQTEEAVLAYRPYSGAWRDNYTDIGVATGADGKNKIIINTATGEWEAWTLGKKATYSGYTASGNDRTHTYSAFSNTSNFSVNIYAPTTEKNKPFAMPYISNVQVREATELSTSSNGDYFYLDLDRSFTTGHKYKISFNVKPTSLEGSKDVFVDVTGGDITILNQKGQAFGLLYVYNSGDDALGYGDWNNIGNISGYKSSVLSDGIDMDIVWDTALGTANVTVIISGREYNFAWNPGVIAANQTYGKLKIGGDTSTVTITDLSVTEVTPEPTAVPTEAPTPTPTPAPVAPEVDMGTAVKAANGANAFYYVINITLNDGTPSSFEVTYHPKEGPGASDTTPAQVYSFTEMNNVAVKLISVLKRIPSGELDREIVCDTTLTYTFGVNPGGTIVQSATSSYNDAL